MADNKETTSERPKISIHKLPEFSVEDFRMRKVEIRPTLIKCLEEVNWKGIVKEGARVTVKVNGTHYEYLPGLTTNPELIFEYVSLLRDRAKEVIVGESDLQRCSGDLALDGAGIRNAAEKAGARVINFSEDKYENVDLKGEVLRKMPIPKAYIDCDVFSTMPLFKTHKLTRVTVGLKNQFGCITDDNRLVYHGKIHKVLADINAFLNPKLIITDGIIALEGDGPIAGIPRKLGILQVSTNIVANDACAAYIMGFDPSKILHIKHASDRGLGTIDLSKMEFTNLKPDDVRQNFEPPPADDFVSRMERAVSGHPMLSKFIYKTMFKPAKYVAWKIRGGSGYKAKYVERIKATGLWDNYEGLFK